MEFIDKCFGINFYSDFAVFRWISAVVIYWRKSFEEAHALWFLKLFDAARI